jgi:hypothetical protein
VLYCLDQACYRREGAGEELAMFFFVHLFLFELLLVKIDRASNQYVQITHILELPLAMVSCVFGCQTSRQYAYGKGSLRRALNARQHRDGLE